jgi:hypothetical protein
MLAVGAALLNNQKSVCASWCVSVFVNLLKPSGNFTYHQV